MDTTNSVVPKSVVNLFIIAVILNIADTLLTIAIMEAGGSEANPYVDWYIQQFGYIGIVIAKVIPFSVLGFTFLKYHEVGPYIREVIHRGLYFVCMAYSVLVCYATYGTYLGYFAK